MTTFFLYTFLVGTGLTLVSFVLGVIDASGIGHGAGHAGDLTGGHGGGDLSAGHGAGDLSTGHGGDLSAGHGGDPSGAHATVVSPINFQTLVGFLVGFGGIGYVSARAGWALWLLAVPAAVAGGMASGWLVYRAMRLLVSGERPLPPTSYVGVVGKLTVGIREGGTGELVYTQNGVRQVVSARTSDGSAIARGEDVVIMRYEKGVAYVESLRNP